MAKNTKGKKKTSSEAGSRQTSLESQNAVETDENSSPSVQQEDAVVFEASQPEPEEVKSPAKKEPAKSTKPLSEVIGNIINTLESEEEPDIEVKKPAGGSKKAAKAPPAAKKETSDNQQVVAAGSENLADEISDEPSDENTQPPAKKAKVAKVAAAKVSIQNVQFQKRSGSMQPVKKKTSLSKKAGIVFPVTRCRNQIRRMLKKKRVYAGELNSLNCE